METGESCPSQFKHKHVLKTSLEIRTRTPWSELPLTACSSIA